MDNRPDGFSWFKRWADAIGQALFRADVTGRRYRVWYDPANRWWNISELTTRHSPQAPSELAASRRNGHG